MKKITTFFLAAIMMLALCACGESNGADAPGVKIEAGKALPADAVLDVMIASHPSWPYEEDFEVWKYIKDGVGGTINITAVPTSDFKTKFPLVMASPDTLPDLIGFQNQPATYSGFCEQGAFVALDDRLDLLPDYVEFWNNVPENEQWLRDTRKGVDGKVYFAPIYGMSRSTNVRTWLYRKDVFEKHNLKTPETMDELYDVCVKLKALYPESYPFCVRQGFDNIDLIGSSWKPGLCLGVYYDFENEKWCYGATEDEIYDMVVFLNKMVANKLMPADFFTINTSTWQELVTTDKGFVMPEYQTRIDFFQNIVREKNPEFTLTAMKPPVAGENGIPMVNKYNVDTMGYSICNTGDEKSIENAFRYVNWMYSDAGELAVSWGKEGETYEVVDGKKKFILPAEGDSARSLYGFTTIGTYLRIDPAAADAFASEEQAATTDMVLEYTYPNLNPGRWLSFTAQESKEMADFTTSITTFVEESIQKFVLGQKPLSEWDEFEKELSELDVDGLLKYYETAYNRVK